MSQFYRDNQGQVRWTATGQLADDSDMPHQDDPPINQVSMLEVAGQARKQAEDAAEAAEECILRAAIRAILDGESPQVVARACSWTSDPPPQDPGGLIMTNAGPIPAFLAEQLGITPADPDRMMKFATWLAQGLVDIVKDGMRQ